MSWNTHHLSSSPQLRLYHGRSPVEVSHSRQHLGDQLEAQGFLQGLFLGLTGHTHPLPTHIADIRANARQQECLLSAQRACDSV